LRCGIGGLSAQFVHVGQNGNNTAEYRDKAGNHNGHNRVVHMTFLSDDLSPLYNKREKLNLTQFFVVFLFFIAQLPQTR
jgi:hypothetical protein